MHAMAEFPHLRPATIRADGRGGALLSVVQGGAAVAVGLDREALWALAMQVFEVLETIEPARRRANGA
jgi:hypothetical protein